MKFWLVISIAFLIAAESQAINVNLRFKRQADERQNNQEGSGKVDHKKLSRLYQDDDTGCIRACGNANLTEDVKTRSMFVLSCTSVTQSVNCFKQCPDSEAKKFVLDYTSHLYGVCNASMDELNKIGECLELNDLREECVDRCPPGNHAKVWPDIHMKLAGDHRPSEPINGVLIKLEKHPDIIKASLPDMCKFESCMLECQKQNITEICGSAAFESMKQGWIIAKMTGNLYGATGLISEVPKECEDTDD